ncbi:HAMP domain-containing protein [Pacificimonas sp. ICDLI1SI03]
MARVRKRLSRMSGRVEFYPRFEITLGLLALIAGFVGYLSLTGEIETASLGPTGRTLLLVGVMVPLMGLFILIARRLALLWLERRRGLLGARMHVRLVGLFAGLAAVPTILVVVFASILFQSGTAFWFSDRAQTVLRNAEEVAQAYVEENQQRIIGDIVAMGGDLDGYARDYGIADETFADGVAWQIAARGLSEAIVFRPRAGGGFTVYASQGETDALGERQVLEQRILPGDLIRATGGDTAILGGRNDRVEAIVRINPGDQTYLYASRTVDPGAVQAADRAAGARSEYSDLLANSAGLQWRFNLMLGGVALLILAAAILSGLWLANRLTSPIARLAEAAERLGEGDLAARVPVRGSPDELGTLARSFNRMARQLESQTGALVGANAEAEERRRFIEAVMQGVTAGVISVDASGRIALVSTAAEELLATTRAALLQRSLADAVPEFSELLARAQTGNIAQGEVRIARDGDTQILLVRAGAVPGGTLGHVLTFDDITQQLADQRRAAWADVARRIAHEIKNPLTPIQLSAERLQRRYGNKLTADADIFEALTSTIVRQVGDLRRMVDEFSSFARMPKPVFERESLAEIARQALFLQEVGNPGISYSLEVEEGLPDLVCDRRQIAQALTNLMKNAAEALQGDERTVPSKIETLLSTHDEQIRIDVCDNGPGLPDALRERVTEPYVTTREKGTGLGLAIVSKIVEEHAGTLLFLDRDSGGMCVRMTFDINLLARHLGEGDDQPSQIVVEG